jgi:hypothetical protein
MMDNINLQLEAWAESNAQAETDLEGSEEEDDGNPLSTEKDPEWLKQDDDKEEEDGEELLPIPLPIPTDMTAFYLARARNNPEASKEEEAAKNKKVRPPVSLPDSLPDPLPFPEDSLPTPLPFPEDSLPDPLPFPEDPLPAPQKQAASDENETEESDENETEESDENETEESTDSLPFPERAPQKQEE